MKKKKKIVHDDDEEYLVADEKGRCFDWFVDAVADFLEGRESDLGKALGKHLARAKRAGTLAPPLKRTKH